MVRRGEQMRARSWASRTLGWLHHNDNRLAKEKPRPGRRPELEDGRRGTGRRGGRSLVKQQASLLNQAKEFAASFEQSLLADCWFRRQQRRAASQRVPTTSAYRSCSLSQRIRSVVGLARGNSSGNSHSTRSCRPIAICLSRRSANLSQVLDVDRGVCRLAARQLRRI
jgi:hypothetical protein